MKKSVTETITAMVNAKVIEEVDEALVGYDTQMLASIAISMKRIADRLDKQPEGSLFERVFGK